MSSYIPQVCLDEIEQLKNSGRFDEAVRKVNMILTKDPSNEDALLQIADIEYRRGEIQKAGKAVDFLNAMKTNDPLGLYIKGILEMEKNNWKEARDYLKKARDLTDGDNHEIIRCYGLCEYWYGNREKGMEYLKDAFEMNTRDAEVIYNIIQLEMLEHNYTEARKMITYFYDVHDELKVVDKPLDWYDKKVALFEKFLKNQHLFTVNT